MSKVTPVFPFSVLWRYFVQVRPWRTYSDEALRLLLLGEALIVLGGSHTLWLPRPASGLGWFVWFFWLYAWLLLWLMLAGVLYEWQQRKSKIHPLSKLDHEHH